MMQNNGIIYHTESVVEMQFICIMTSMLLNYTVA